MQKPWTSHKNIKPALPYQFSKNKNILLNNQNCY
jgi:hypothetical protein